MSTPTKFTASRKWIFEVLLLNLICRAAWLLFMHPSQKADFLWYFDHARMLANGQGYVWGGQPTAYWPIGWPFFLSLIFRVTGSYVFVGLVVNVLLSTCIVGLIYLISKHLFPNSRIPLIAAIAYSCLPSQIEWNAILGSEELFTTLLLCALYVYLKAKNAPTYQLWMFALVGLILGFASDVRPIPLLFPVFLLLYEWIVWRRQFLHSLYRALVVTIAMFVAILPVTVRNYIAMHHFVLVSTNGGMNLWQGTHINGGYFWSWNPSVNPLLHINNEIVKNQVAEHVALTYILHHIPGTIGNGFLKIFDLYKVDNNVVLYTFHVVPGLKYLASGIGTFNTIVYWIFMLFACIGLWKVIRGKVQHARECWLLLAFIIYNTSFFFFFPAWDRFRYPLMPLFGVFTGLGLYQVWHWMRGNVRHASNVGKSS